MKKYIYTLVAIICMGVLFSSCKDDKDGSAVNVTVTNAVYENGQIHYIKAIDNVPLQLESFIMPRSAAEANVTYEVKSDSVLAITPEGLITSLVSTPATDAFPVPLAVDTIIARVNDGSGTFVKYPVRIHSHIVIATDIKLGGMNQIGENKQLDLAKMLVFVPADTSDKTATYFSSDESIVSVDANGMLTAKGAIGESVIITVTSNDRGMPIKEGSKIGEKAQSNFYIKIIDKAAIDVDRAGWLVTLSYAPNIEKPGTADENGRADQLVDNKAGTFLSLAKPGRPGSPIAEGTECYFILDMTKEVVFDNFRVQHRNATAIIRVWEVSLFGSNDLDADFTEIKKNVVIPGAAAGGSTSTGNIEIPESKYRYLKVKYEDWSKTGGGTMQIAEFYLAKYP